MAVIVLLAWARCGPEWRWSSRFPWLTKSGSASDEAMPGDPGDPFPSIQPTGKDSAEPIQVLLVEFDILRVEIPSEPVRHSQKVWNHVDELRVDPDLAGALARNGVRLGVSSSASWPALRAVFQASGARVERVRHSASSSLPLLLDLGSFDRPATVFAYDRRGGMSGRTLPRGRRIVRLDYDVHPAPRLETDLRVAFDILPEQAASSWVVEPSSVTTVVPLYSFSDLTSVLTLSADEFLVIGPGEETTNAYLIGSTYFRRPIQGRRFDTVLCITPRVFRRNLEVE